VRPYRSLNEQLTGRAYFPVEARRCTQKEWNSVKISYSSYKATLQQGVNLKHVVLTILLLGLLLFRPLVPNTVVDAVFLPTMIVSTWLAGGKTRSSFIVTVVSSLGALGVLLFDLLAHEQFSTFFRQPLGFPVAAAILVLFVYSAVVILRSLLTTERVFVNEIIRNIQSVSDNGIHLVVRVSVARTKRPRFI
jgi:hypothetical protein